MKLILLVAITAVLPGAAQGPLKLPEVQAGAVQSSSVEPHAADVNRFYALGVEDQITVRALHVEEITETPIRIGGDGYIRLPLAGRIHAAGMTVGELEEAIVGRLRPFVVDPEVWVSVSEFRSGPVSVLGAVKNPGVYQLQGKKTVAEMLSLAGGPDATAASVVKITRGVDRGPIPVASAAVDASGKFNVAEISLVSILKGARHRLRSSGRDGVCHR
jgi:polysaccharide export outer membrane protein